MKARIKVITISSYEVDVVAATLEDAREYATQGSNSSNKLYEVDQTTTTVMKVILPRGL